jgi:hypothetical protein
MRNGVSLQSHGIEPSAKFRVGDGDRGVRIRQVKLQQIGRRQRIDQQRHEAGADRAEERGRIGRRIVTKHQDAIAALQSERLKTVSPSRCVGAKLGVRSRSSRPDDRKPVTPATGKIVEQDAAGVVSLRNSETDFQSAGAVGRHPVCDLARLVLRAHTLLPLLCNARSPRDASYRAMNSGDIARSRASSIRPERVM